MINDLSLNHLSIFAVTMVFHHPSVNQLVSIGLGVPAGLYVAKPSFLHFAMCSFAEVTPPPIYSGPVHRVWLMLRMWRKATVRW